MQMRAVQRWLVCAAVVLAVLATGSASQARTRDEIADRYKWHLSDIYPSWDAWSADMERIQGLMDQYVALKGTLSTGAPAMLKTETLGDEIGKLAYKLYGYAFLSFDLDQRNNEVNGKRQRVQILFARYETATAWFTPEMLAIPRQTMEGWIDQTPALQPYRFPIMEAYRRQEHVLDEAGETLLSYATRFNHSPDDTYDALATADVRFDSVTLADGTQRRVSNAVYQEILQTNRNQADRAGAFAAHYGTYAAQSNTYAAVYDGVCQRDWYLAQSRKYPSTLAAALDDDGIPTSVYENLIAVTRAGVAPLQRYHRLRHRVLGLESYHLYDGGIPLVPFDKRYPFDAIEETILASVAPLGQAYQEQMGKGFAGGWLDVYESEGKQSGAYSMGVYGVHPFMLLNYNDTLEEVFTVGHEMGHTMHTILSQETQPFATCEYTIFVAEVASTLNEALLLDYMLAHTTDPAERVVLLTHAIDNIVGTYYAQVLFADYEIQAHRRAEQGEPITADALGELYHGLLKEYYGDALDLDEVYRFTWARIPHFYGSPYYVYQYATCFASSAKLVQDILPPPADKLEPMSGAQRKAAERARTEARDRYLTLLRSGGNDLPMDQLRKAGVDLSQPATVQAVIDQFDALVTQLESELARLGPAAPHSRRGDRQ